MWNVPDCFGHVFRHSAARVIVPESDRVSTPLFLAFSIRFQQDSFLNIPDATSRFDAPPAASGTNLPEIFGVTESTRITRTFVQRLSILESSEPMNRETSSSRLSRVNIPETCDPIPA